MLFFSSAPIMPFLRLLKLFYKCPKTGLPYIQGQKTLSLKKMANIFPNF